MTTQQHVANKQREEGLGREKAILSISLRSDYLMFPLHTCFPSLEDLPDSGYMEDLFPGSFWSWMPFTEKMDAAEDRKGAMKHLHPGCLTCCSVCTHYLPAFGPDPRGFESTSV